MSSLNTHPKFKLEQLHYNDEMDEDDNLSPEIEIQNTRKLQVEKTIEDYENQSSNIINNKMNSYENYFNKTVEREAEINLKSKLYSDFNLQKQLKKKKKNVKIINQSCSSPNKTGTNSEYYNIVKNMIQEKKQEENQNMKSKIKFGNKKIETRLIEFKGELEKKKQQAKEEHESEKMKDCTFCPNIKNESDKRRSLSSFLIDQIRHETKKKEALIKIQEEIDFKKHNTLTLRPEINPASLKILNSKIKNKASVNDKFSVYDRLYSEKFSGNVPEQTAEITKSKLFIPSIDEKSQLISRDENISDRLFNDALRRQKTTLNDEKNSEINKVIAPKIDKILIKKFKKEFNKAVNALGIFTERIDNLKLREILFETKFLNENKLIESENKLVDKISSILKDNLTVPNLCKILMGIMKIKFDIEANDQSLNHLQNNEVNKNNEYCTLKNNGEIIISYEQALNLNRHFHIFYVNRINCNEKKIHIFEDKECTFKPAIDQESLKIASEGNKMKGQRSALKNYDLNSKRKDLVINRDSELNDDLKKMNVIKDAPECTFHPQTNCTKDNALKEISSMRTYNELSSGNIVRGDRCNDLFQLSKGLKKNPDKSVDEVEYEKNKDKFTFTPKTNKFCLKKKPTKGKEENEIIKKNQNEILSIDKKMNNNKTTKEKVPNKNYSQKILKSINSKQKLKEKSREKPKSFLSESKSGRASYQKMKETDDKSLKKSPNTQDKGRNDSESTPNIEGALKNDERNSTVKSEEDQIPLLFVDVNLGEGRSERIVVYEHQSAEELAKKFISDNHLDERLLSKLIYMLNEQISNLLTKIEETKDENEKSPDKEN